METPGLALGGRKRIVLATYGSLGDLHPILALAKALRGRGHEPVVATSELHRARVERQGVAFHPARPHLLDLESDPEVWRRAMDLKTGPKFVIGLMMGCVRESFDDLRAAAEGADLLVSHPMTFAAPAVAALRGLPWVSVTLAPLGMFSAYDPVVPPSALWLRHARPLGPAFWRLVWAGARRVARRWSRPLDRLYRGLGLPPLRDPLMGGLDSPYAALVMFSEALGAPQPDWPPRAVQTGFAFLDDSLEEGLSAELSRFLDAGPAPLVFTLGSSAVMDAGGFYEESLAAVAALGRRAVLLTGNDPRNQPAGPLPGAVIAVPYAPHSALFPRASAVVHQGGVGTTGQAMRAGRPMLVVPWGFDQPDNADRVRRLGVGLTVARDRYNARTAARALRRLLDDPSFAARAEEVGRRVRTEDGAAAACDVIERVLAAHGRERAGRRAEDR